MLGCFIPFGVKYGQTQPLSFNNNKKKKNETKPMVGFVQTWPQMGWNNPEFF